MNACSGVVAISMLVACVHSALLAQERIFRCGNEYTNNVAWAKQHNCQVLIDGHVTVVHSKPGRPTTQEAQSNGAAPATRAIQVDAVQQRVRDSDAQAILQAELAKAKQKLQSLKEQFNNGQPVKSALELRNPQFFQERINALKTEIARQEADVLSIQRELARYTR